MQNKIIFNLIFFFNVSLLNVFIFSSDSELLNPKIIAINEKTISPIINNEALFLKTAYFKINETFWEITLNYGKGNGD